MGAEFLRVVVGVLLFIVFPVAILAWPYVAKKIKEKIEKRRLLKRNKEVAEGVLNRVIWRG